MRAVQSGVCIIAFLYKLQVSQGFAILIKEKYNVQMALHLLTLNLIVSLRYRNLIKLLKLFLDFAQKRINYPQLFSYLL